MIHWLVLTGGASTRLGHDKASALLDGRSLVERALASIESVDPGASVTEVGADRPGGPAAAVVSVLPMIQADLVGVLAVDMPFAQQVLAELVEVVDVESVDIEAWVPVGADERRQWLCAVYRRDALVRATHEGVGGSSDWHSAPFHRLVGALTTSLVSIASDVSLLDIDTPEDFERAQRVVEDFGN